MGKEIERKFLVKDESYKKRASRVIEIRQAYLSTSPDSVVRIRVCGPTAFLTIKSRTHGCERGEWEYPVPVSDAIEIMDTCSCSPVISKTRYIVGRWEIDEFHGSLTGLTVAEIELEDADESFERPSFLGREVTGDPRYYNSVLTSSGELPPVV